MSNGYDPDAPSAQEQAAFEQWAQDRGMQIITNDPAKVEARPDLYTTDTSGSGYSQEYTQQQLASRGKSQDYVPVGAGGTARPTPTEGAELAARASDKSAVPIPQGKQVDLNKVQFIPTSAFEKTVSRGATDQVTAQTRQPFTQKEITESIKSAEQHPLQMAELQQAGNTFTKAVIPGLWAEDWKQLTPAEQTLNIALDALLIIPVVGGVARGTKVGRVLATPLLKSEIMSTPISQLFKSPAERLVANTAKLDERASVGLTKLYGKDVGSSYRELKVAKTNYANTLIDSTEAKRAFLRTQGSELAPNRVYLRNQISELDTKLVNERKILDANQDQFVKILKQAIAKENDPRTIRTHKVIVDEFLSQGSLARHTEQSINGMIPTKQAIADAKLALQSAKTVPDRISADLHLKALQSKADTQLFSEWQDVSGKLDDARRQLALEAKAGKTRISPERAALRQQVAELQVKADNLHGELSQAIRRLDVEYGGKELRSGGGRTLTASPKTKSGLDISTRTGGAKVGANISTEAALAKLGTTMTSYQAAKEAGVEEATVVGAEGMPTPQPIEQGEPSKEPSRQPSKQPSPSPSKQPRPGGAPEWQPTKSPTKAPDKTIVKQEQKMPEKTQVKVPIPRITPKLIPKPTPQLKPSPAPQLQPEPVREKTPVPDKTPPKEPPKRPLQLPSDSTENDKKKRERIKKSKGATTLRMGQLHGKDVWHVWLDSGEEIVVLGRVPEGATVLAQGKGSAYETTQRIGSGAFSPFEKVFGAVRARISPNGAGKGAQVSFAPTGLRSERHGKIFHTKVGDTILLSRRPLGRTRRRV